MGQASRRSHARKNAGLPAWLWTLVGIALGGGGMALYFMQQEKTTAPEKPAAATPPATAQDLRFYEILPKMEVVVPPREENGGVREPKKTDEPATYIVQVGSFKSFPEADALKANLALMGVESKIETITINNRDTWHRVVSGPYRDLREADKIRARLRNNNINHAIVLKLSG